ncbi:uncharacterized protein LOC62_04G005877 [Vanrija pseudolonga]|uniref:Transcriptional regulatory protein RXT2 N-terminal domain-containing protein n=1 Tax=Vanrija pseudolonga TaxID=143232 RepID=A0AAF0YF65_9TREE|nr:hypothetical protein LOC62_04G005877 [Vanrija pseudolonga]
MPPHADPSGRYSSHSSRREKVVKQADIEVLPSMDQPAYYDPPSPVSSTDSLPIDYVSADFVTNSGNKLDPSARWIRNGKICAWGPSYEASMRKQRTRKRLELCLEQLLPESAAELGIAPPQNIVDSEANRRERKRKRAEEKEFELPHLSSPSPPMTTMELAPMLSIPKSYLDIVTSPAMRYSLGDDSMERGLQQTAADLLEGEKGLMQALGRLREVLRVRDRDVAEGRKKPSQPHANGSHAGANGDAPAANGHPDGTPANGQPLTDADYDKLIPPLPHVSDTDNLWRVTQEILQNQPPPTIHFTVTPPGAAYPAEPDAPAPPKPTPLQRIFTCPTGITFNADPNAQLQQHQRAHGFAAQSIKYNLDLGTQQRAVDDAIERIMELLADCNEYKERIEEARERVADVARTRKFVWKVIKRRAGRELDRMEGKQ